MDRRPWRRDIFLEPYNGHLPAVPIAIYKLLFVTVGIDSVALYRLTLLGLHLVCVALLFVYARRRVGDWLAVLVAASLLFLGSGWHDLLVPFQIGFLVSIAAVLGALLLQDRRAWGADVGIAVLVALSLGSSSIGIPLAAGVLAETALSRDRLRRLWGRLRRSRSTCCGTSSTGTVPRAPRPRSGRSETSSGTTFRSSRPMRSRRRQERSPASPGCRSSGAGPPSYWPRSCSSGGCSDALRSRPGSVLSS